MLLLAVVTLSLMAPGQAGARDAAIRDLFVTNTEDEVLLYFRVSNTFTSAMEEAVLAGITTTFIFTIELYQHRGIRYDRKETTIEVRHSLKYDSIKKTFYLSHSYLPGEPRQFPELEMIRAQRAMADVSGLPIVRLDRLVRGQPYYVRVRARLDKAALPQDVRTTMLFFSLWYFETDWARQDFVY
jgi:hypothetical protein